VVRIDDTVLYKDSKEVTGKTTKRREKEGRPRLRCMDDDDDDDDELDLSNVGVKKLRTKTELATVMRGEVERKQL